MPSVRSAIIFDVARRSIIVWRFGLLISIASIAPGLQAQTPLAHGRITGSVGDPIGSEIPGASVELRHSGSTKALVTVTIDYAGKYVLSDLAPGTYDLQVDAPGFKATIISAITVRSGEELKVAQSRLAISLDEAECILQVTAAPIAKARRTKSPKKR